MSTAQNQTKRVIGKVISIRKKLIQNGCSGKNTARCFALIKELSIQIEAHGNKWDSNGWKAFAQRNMDKIMFLIPENKAGETLKNQLYEL